MSLDGAGEITGAHLGRVLLLGPPSLLEGGDRTAPAGGGRYTALAHTGQGQAARSVIVSSHSALDPVLHLGPDVCAIVVPDVLLPPQPVVGTVVHLFDGPLVRASREMTRALCATLAPRRSPASVRAAEDVAVTIVRDVLHEHYAALAGDLTDDMQRLVWDTIAERHCDPQFAVGVLAREVHLSRRQLYRRLPGDAGPADVIARHRLSTATRLIRENPGMSLAEVATRSGFSSIATMRSTFVARLGVTPTAYRGRSVDVPA